jgi:hypothetical protein
LFRPWNSSGVGQSVQRKWSFRLQDSLFNCVRLIIQAKPPYGPGQWKGLGPISIARYLRAVFSRMDDDVRVAFVLCDLVEVPVEDASQMVQSSPQVVRRRTYCARLMLRGFLERLWSV